MTALSHALLADVLVSLENASGTPLGPAAYLQVQELVQQLPATIQPEELKTLLAPLLCRSPEEQEQFYALFKKSWARVQETGELQAMDIEQVEMAAQVEKRKRWWWNLWIWAAIAGGLVWGSWAMWQWTQRSVTDPVSTANAGGQPRDTMATVLLEVIAPAPDTALYAQRRIPHPRDLNQLGPPQPTAWQQFLLNYEWPLKAILVLLSGLLLWWLARRIERNRRRLIAEYQPNTKPPYAWNITLGTEPEVAFGEDFYALLLQLRRREGDEHWRLDMPRTIRATVEKGGLPQFRYAQQTRPAEYLLLIDRQNGRDHQARLFDLLYRTFRSQEVLVERYWYDEGDPRRCCNETHPNGLRLRDLHYYHPHSRLLLLGNAYALLHPGSGNPAKWASQTFAAWSDRAVLSTQPLSTFGRRERSLQTLFHVLPASLSGLRDAVDLFDADEGKIPDLHPRRFPDAAQEPIQLMENDLIKTLQWMVDGGRNTVDGKPFIILWIAACALYPELHWDLTLQLGHLLDGISTNTGATPDHPGTPLSASNTSLLTQRSLQTLCRLPWFVEGEMPLEVRRTLLAWLEREHPEIHYRLREGLHRLLAQNPPPTDSAAYDDYALNLALNEWLYTRDRDRKKQLQREIAARLAAGQQADFMVLRMLQSGRSLTPEQFEVPRDWKKHLREKGFAFLNPRRAWWWAVPVWLALSGLALWWQPERVLCDGLTATHHGQEYCLENFEEWAIFREMLLQEKLESGQKASADSLSYYISEIGWGNGQLTRNHLSNRLWIERITPSTSSAGAASTDTNRTLGLQMQMLGELVTQNVVYAGVVRNKPRLDSISFLQNAAVAYFNEGVKIHTAYASLWDAVERSGQRPVGTDYHTRAEACAYFTRAQELNAPLPDTAQLWYVRDVARVCAPDTAAVDNLFLRGRLLDATTQQPIRAAALVGARVEGEGLKPGTVRAGAYFSVDLPANWNSTVRLTVLVNGYKPLRLTVSGAQQNVVLSLVPAAPGASLTKIRPPSALNLVDGDGDGVPDAQDRCPAEKGAVDNQGCPAVVPARQQQEAVAEIERVLVRIAGGSFLMGCDNERDGNCQLDEKPTRRVNIESFYLSRFEVTASQWTAIMEQGAGDCPDCPVTEVSWEDAQAFIQKLNELTTGPQYRLPTEAEWEYAAHGGRRSQYAPFAGADLSNLPSVAWFSSNAGGRPHPVGQKKDNTIGIFDLSGNVSEWCLDWYDAYQAEEVDNPRGPEKGRRRVCRGGGFLSPAPDCRIANRNSFLPDSRNGDVGFRLVRSIGVEKIRPSGF